jgi:hypothetical protein
MDVVGRIYLQNGAQLHASTGIDDHSRFCVCENGPKLLRMTQWFSSHA